MNQPIAYELTPTQRKRLEKELTCIYKLDFSEGTARAVIEEVERILSEEDCDSCLSRKTCPIHSPKTDNYENERLEGMKKYNNPKTEKPKLPELDWSMNEIETSIDHAARSKIEQLRNYLAAKEKMS